jgi:DNA (cytosine-5)-methyltransferase 1
MNHGSLFSGIGGFDLAAEWMGWDNIFHCEWMPFPRQVLKYHFPNSISYEDITKTDFTIHRGSIDILTGGFPCQPYSSAGKRLGKEDERHLWPHMLRAIQEIEPTYVVGENVRGLTNWNGGVVLEEVCADLESCGYEVQPVLLPASSVGAPHQRQRIWFVAANPNSIRQHKREFVNEINSSERRFNALNDINENDRQGITPNPNNERLQRGEVKTDTRQTQRERELSGNTTRQISPRWENFPTQSPICSGDDGLPSELDGITFSKWRQESIKGYGNAIVPQVAYEIFKTIEHLHNEKL